MKMHDKVWVKKPKIIATIFKTHWSLFTAIVLFKSWTLKDAYWSHRLIKEEIFDKLKLFQYFSILINYQFEIFICYLRTQKIGF